MDARDLLESVKHRVLRLDHARAAVIATACAQRLAASADDVPPEIAGAIVTARDRRVGASARSALADHLERRADADDDLIAATIYSLRAGAGSLEDGWWTVSRFIDAAFERATGDDAMTPADSLDNEAGQPAVRSELDWLQAIVTAAESAADDVDLAHRLESP